MSANCIGIDLGGTKICAVRTGMDGKVKERLLVPTPRSKEDAIEEIVRIVKALQDQSTKSIGIGVPGPVDFGKQTVRSLPNLQGWRDVPLSKTVSKRTGIPCAIDNDAKCFLLAEMKIGAAKGRKNVFGLVIGTGIGGAIAIDGKIYRGAHGLAGEAGHVVMSGKKGNPAAKNPGSLEALASGEAVMYEAQASNAKIVFEQALAGRALAGQIIAETADDLGTGIANLVNILDPEMVVLGGSVASQLDLMLPRVRAQLARLCFPQACDVPIVQAKVKDAGAVGAALLAEEFC